MNPGTTTTISRVVLPIGQGNSAMIQVPNQNTPLQQVNQQASTSAQTNPATTIMEAGEMKALKLWLDTIHIDKNTTEEGINDKLSSFNSIERLNLIRLLGKGMADIKQNKEEHFHQSYINKIVDITRIMNSSDGGHARGVLIRSLRNPGVQLQPAELRQSNGSTSSPNKRPLVVVSSDTTYNVTQPKNIKFDNNMAQSDHIIPWTSSGDRGYSLQVTGPEYKRGMTTDFIGDVDEYFGRLISITESDTGATITVDREDGQKKLTELINNSNAGLSATPNALRFPIIKIWLDKRLTGMDMKATIQELRSFNFKGKNFKEKTFEFWKLFGTTYSEF
uniref:Uncharacterized protein n=1 Tax=Tetranychus urticae TaxID=32264 RepID=T1KI36_TETUR